MGKWIHFGSLRNELTGQNYKLLRNCLIAAAVIVVIVEILARRSIDDTLTFMAGRFPAFVYNVLLVFLTLTFALIFRKRTFSFFLAGGIWIGVAIANSILLSFRSMPLTAPDIWLMGSVRTIFDKYMSYFELGLLMLGISAAIAAILYILFRAEKFPRIFGFGVVHFVLTLFLVILTTLLFQNVGFVQKTKDFTNLPRAYQENGFCYCFAASLLTGGVEEPQDYSDEIIHEIKDKNIDLPATTEDLPNIVFVQLESFFDPNYMLKLVYEENPVPNFQALRENYPSGFLSVPCIGAGTANTEFEVLTGMNLSHFGVGEYPYMTIVDSVCPETVAYSLSGIGYSTHAIHNNNATFYDRDIVYSNLNFDTFTSLEYMDIDPESDFTPTDWAKDAFLTEEILKCMESSEEQDFVFTVSVQPHGRYPSEYSEEYSYLKVEGMVDESRRIGFEYYLYQLRQTDEFVGALVQALSNYDEKTVVVFYGDHLPSFNIRPEELSAGTEQTTEYIVWANFDIGNEKRDLQTYQLSAYVMGLCEIYEGAIFRLHQSYDFPNDEDKEFQDALLVLEYDMLDGEHIAMDGNLIEPTPLRFDVEDILIERMEADAELPGTYHIYGQNFTRFSAVCVNGAPCLTKFVSKEHLIFTIDELENEDEITVAQISAAGDMEILSTTDGWLWFLEETDESSDLNETE